MEQNKPTPIAVSAVKPASPAGVATVRPITPVTSAPAAKPAAAPAKPAAAVPAKPAAKPVAKKKPAKKKKPAAKKPAVKKAAPAKKPVAKKAAPAIAKKPAARKAKPARKARKPIARKAVAAKKPAPAKKPASASASKSSWSFSAPKSPFGAAPKAPKFSAEAFAPFGADALKGLFGPAAEEVQKISEKAFGFGKDGADQFAKSADAATRSINEAVALSQDNMEACVECGNIAAEFSKTVSEELFEFGNSLFAKNVDLSKKVFACRTINDMFDLQSKVFKTNIDSVFNETAKISEMAFKMASKATEPLNDRAAEASKRMRKAFAA